MERVIKRITKRNLIKLFINIAFVFLFSLPIIFSGFSINDLKDKNNCEISTYEDVEKCVKSGDYFVEIHATSMKNTNHFFKLVRNEDEIVAYLVDVELKDANGGVHSLIGVLPTSKTNSYLGFVEKVGKVSFKTHLGKFGKNNAYDEQYELVKQEYQKSNNKKEVMDLNFDSYNFTNTRKFMSIYLGCLLLIVVSFAISAIQCLIKVLNPRKNEFFKFVDKSEYENILKDNKFLLDSSKIKITKDYFYSVQYKNEFALPLKQIVWVYGKCINDKSKQTYKLIVNLDNGKKFEVLSSKERISDVFDILKSMNSKIVTDYTSEYQEKYNKNPKEFI